MAAEIWMKGEYDKIFVIDDAYIGTYYDCIKLYFFM